MAGRVRSRPARSPRSTTTRSGHAPPPAAPARHDCGVGTERTGLDQGEMPRLVQDLLDLLRHRSGFGLVMLTRVIGDDWQVVAVTENPYGVAAGDVFRWSDSVCSRMIVADGPVEVIPDVAGHEVASAAPVTGRLAIASYAGAPVVGDDGRLVGTVCAIDPSAQGADLDVELFAFAGRLGAHALSSAASTRQADRRAERALFPSRVVPAEAWPALVDVEAVRVRWTNERLSVALARVLPGGRRPDVDRALRLLAEGIGPDDVASLLGSNRIGILCVDRPADELQSVLDAVSAEVPLVAVAGDVSGPDVRTTLEELEAELVGTAAAAARSSSRLLRYSFCDDCGRKGRYRSPSVEVTRCKYCGAVEHDASP